MTLLIRTSLGQSVNCSNFCRSLWLLVCFNSMTESQPDRTLTQLPGRFCHKIHDSGYAIWRWIELQEDALALGTASPPRALLALGVQGVLGLSGALEGEGGWWIGLATLLILTVCMQKDVIRAFYRPWVASFLACLGWKEDWVAVSEAELPELEDTAVIANEAWQRGREQRKPSKREGREVRHRTIEEEEEEEEEVLVDEVRDVVAERGLGDEAIRRRLTAPCGGSSSRYGGAKRGNTRQCACRTHWDTSKPCASDCGACSEEADGVLPPLLASKRVPPAGWLVYDPILGLVTYEESIKWREGRRSAGDRDGGGVGGTKGGGGRGNEGSPRTKPGSRTASRTQQGREKKLQAAARTYRSGGALSLAREIGPPSSSVSA